MSSSLSTAVPLEHASLRRRLVWPYVLTVVAGAVVAATAGGTNAIEERPLLFAALVAALLLLHGLRTQMVATGHQTPTTIPAIALALLFGPAAPVAAEAACLVAAVAQHRTPKRSLFDFGALGLAGAAAGVVGLWLPTSGDAVALTGAVAALAYVVVNNALLLIVWVLDEGRSAVALARERLGGTEIYEIAYGTIAGLLVLGGQRLGPMVIAFVGVPVAALWIGHKQSAKRARDNVERLEASNDRLRTLMLQTVESLARTIEARDPYTGGHTERVGGFALALARRLGFSADELRGIAVGSVIHDIGKIGIPDAVLLKQGPLTDEEWTWMRRHPEIGAYILGELDIPQIAKDMAAHHHERYDGGGYPSGIAGERIPLAARVLTVADALDAMTSDRPYRRALSFHAALAEITAKSGTQFCPKVVDALLACRKAGELSLTSAGTP